MSKAENTRSYIIERAAGLFNQRGYAGASIADLMAATGLKKGGIYNHFASKDELAIAAFDFAVDLAGRQRMKALKGQRTGSEKLTAIVHSFVEHFDAMSAFGGCPLMNMAIDSDDTHPVLRDRVRQAMDSWHSLVVRITQKAVDRGEFVATTNPEAVATIVISTLEGALMLGKLYGDRVYLERAASHLVDYVHSLRTESA